MASYKKKEGEDNIIAKNFMATWYSEKHWYLYKFFDRQSKENFFVNFSGSKREAFKFSEKEKTLIKKSWETSIRQNGCSLQSLGLLIFEQVFYVEHGLKELFPFAKAIACPKISDGKKSLEKSWKVISATEGMKTHARQFMEAILAAVKYIDEEETVMCAFIQLGMKHSQFLDLTKYLDDLGEAAKTENAQTSEGSRKSKNVQSSVGFRAGRGDTKHAFQSFNEAFKIALIEKFDDINAEEAWFKFVQFLLKLINVGITEGKEDSRKRTKIRDMFRIKAEELFENTCHCSTHSKEEFVEEMMASICDHCETYPDGLALLHEYVTKCVCQPDCTCRKHGRCSVHLNDEL